MTDNNEITQVLNVKVDTKELWSAVFGSGFETYEWYSEVEYLDGAGWDTPGQVRIVIDCWDDDEEPVEKVLSPNDILAVWAKFVEEGKTYWGTSYMDIDQADADFGDSILQYAILGDEVYG